MRKIEAVALALALGIQPISASAADFDLFGTNYVFENNLLISSLAAGECVQTGTGGILTVTGSPCGTGSGTVTAVTGSGNILSSGGATPNITTVAAPTFSGALTAASLTGTGLTSGDCVQASTAGLLTTTAGACGTGSGTVTSVTGTINQITSTNPTTTPVLSIPTTFIAPGTIEATTSLKAGNLTSGDCLSSTSGIIVSTSTACSAGGGSVTSVTSANALISVANPTTTPVLTANETPTFTGTVTSPKFTSTNTLFNGFSFASSVVGCVDSLGSQLSSAAFGSCVASTGASFVIPAIGSSVTVTQQTGQVVSDFVGEPFTITDGTHIISGHVTTNTFSGLTFPFTVDSITAGAVGNTVTTGAPIYSGGISSSVTTRSAGSTLGGTHIETVPTTSVAGLSSGTFTFGAAYTVAPVCTISTVTATLSVTPAFNVGSVTTTVLTVENTNAATQSYEALCIGF
jgi:hypothetical protein